MQIVFDFMLQWLFNAMEIGAAIWVILRVVEKVCDIALKVQDYERMRRAETE